MAEHENTAMETIPEFFSGKHVFITGGSGFMGKVLVEKLLRCCPNIGNIYLLMRPKRGVCIQDRVDKLTNVELFDELKKKNDSSIEKIVPILGNVNEIQLGLSDEDLKRIIDNVSIIYHAAATVRFDSPLNEAIITNTRGTREMCNIVMKCKKPPIMIYISTAYCQHDKEMVEEILYPPPTDWKDAITIAENMDKTILPALTSKYAYNYPNTYTFSKALAESVVADICGNKIPTIIFRPTIVVSTWKDPIPGWCENLNGPYGVSAASTKGIVRSMHFPERKKMNFVPVDFITNGILIATWLERNNKDISIYNGAGTDNLSPDRTKLVQNASASNVPTLILWHPSYYETTSKLVHMVHLYLFHMLPAIFIDLVLRMFNKKPQFLKLIRKIFTAFDALEYFMQNEWKFKNKKFVDLDNHLLPQDKNLFSYDMASIDLLEMCKIMIGGGMKYIFKEKEEDRNFYKTLAKIMFVVHHVLRTSAALYIGIYTYNNLLVPMCDNYYDYLIKL